MKQQLSGKRAKVIIILFVLLVGLLAVAVFNKNSRDYDNPSYRDYLKGIEYCNQFYGGGKVSPSKETYEAWKRKDPIPC